MDITEVTPCLTFLEAFASQVEYTRRQPGEKPPSRRIHNELGLHCLGTYFLSPSLSTLLDAQG